MYIRIFPAAFLWRNGTGDTERSSEEGGMVWLFGIGNKENV